MLAAAAARPSRHLVGSHISKSLVLAVTLANVAATSCRHHACTDLCTQAHAGGCCSLSFQPHGHLVASCGMDKTVQTWDLNLSSHVNTYHVSEPQPAAPSSINSKCCLWHVGTWQQWVGKQVAGWLCYTSSCAPKSYA
jgi:WD40 repeat protein